MTLADQWQYYTVNVKILGTMTHEQFVKERPNAAAAIEKASRFMDAMARLVEKEQ